jgi:UDP-N-acetylglucosamine enolpyruvyl transferase
MKGDVKFAEVLEKMGAKVEWTEHSVTVTGASVGLSGKRLKGIDVDMNSMPDVAMTLAVMGLFADGPVAIRDGELHNPLHTFTARRMLSQTSVEEISTKVQSCSACLTVPSGHQ